MTDRDELEELIHEIVSEICKCDNYMRLSYLYAELEELENLLKEYEEKD